MSIYVSLLTAGTNDHEETSENANAVATDFVSEGVIGATTNTSGVAPSTGAFAVNAQDTPDMTVKVSSGIAYVEGTPTSQDSQTLRVRMSADTDVTISDNSSGSTKYDFVYVKLDADKMANPGADADDVATLVTSRSSSSSSDNGTPPTYGYCIGAVTVADSVSSISNANITDKRVLAKSAQDGSVDTDTLADSVYTLLGDFSTDEAATPFKWIDGKTIYKKTVDIAPLPNTTDKTVAHGITNISNIISVSGWALATSGSSFPLPFASYVANQGVDVYANTTNIVAGAGIDRSSFTTAYVTLLYTKTS